MAECIILENINIPDLPPEVYKFNYNKNKKTKLKKN